MEFMDEDEEDSFVVLDENPEDSIGQMTLMSLTTDQAVYTIGTLTQRVEQLTEALQQCGAVIPKMQSLTLQNSQVPKINNQDRVSSTTQTKDDSTGTSDKFTCTESSTVSSTVQTFINKQDASIQTDLEEEKIPLSQAPQDVKDTIFDLRCAMERLSAEKITSLTSISERDRRINKLKVENESLKKGLQEMDNNYTIGKHDWEQEKGMLLEVLDDNKKKIEEQQIEINRMSKTLASYEAIKIEHQKQVESLKEEVASLRYAAHMMYQENSGRPLQEPVSVDRRDAPQVPMVSYPFDSIPEGRRHY